jgi:hypothetical protein
MANHRRDVTGQELGHLTALHPTGKTTRYGVVWLIQCRCGKKIKMSLSEFVRGHNKHYPRTCGCVRKRMRSSKYKGIGDLSHTRWRNITKTADRRGYEIGITISGAWKLFEKQKGLCALTGLPIQLAPTTMKAGTSTASLDRIDSKKGYIKGNVQWVHRDINFMKQAFPQDVFVEWCVRVARHSHRGRR